MRLVAALAALALGGAAAAQPVSTQPLAAGEVLLELNATGTVTTRADRVVLTYSIVARAANDEAARTAAEAEIRRIREAALRAGATAGDVESTPVTVSPNDTMVMTEPAMFDVAEEPPPLEEPPPGEPAPPPAPEPAPLPSAGASQVTIRLANSDRIETLRAEIVASSAVGEVNATYALSDARAARGEARRQALASARADADAYAAAAGLRVLRIVRVTERAGFDFMSMMTSEAAMTRRLNGGNQTSPDVETLVSVGVDFALAPR